MKTGLTTSLVLHTVVLGFGLVTLSSPSPMELGDIETFPVDIVPLSDISQSVQGERDAPAEERPAPTPTARTDVVEDARKVGDNTVDTDAPPTPNPKPRPVEAAEAPPPASTSQPTPKPQPEPQPASEPEPVPTTEVTPEPQPQQDVAPDPTPEPTDVAEVLEAQETAVDLPASVPSPQARPQPPQAQTARTPERREPEKRQEPHREAAASQSDTQSIEDQVAALLNREQASGGGAQRSTDQAALGGRQTNAARLTQSERDIIISQLRACWNVPVGAEEMSNLNTRVRFKLGPSGKLDGVPVVEQGSGNKQFDESTIRAVQICSTRGFQLPSDKYDTWSEIVVNFSPRDMF